MKKIMFVNLYDFTSLKRVQIPLGILSLYFIVKKSDKYDVEICDFNDIYYEGILKDESLLVNIENMSNYIIQKNTDLISIYTMCNNYHIAVYLGKRIRELQPNIKIVFAGPHATMVGKETLMDFSFVDYVGLGEGEKTIIKLMDGIFNNDVDTVNGIAFRKGDQIICNWDRKDVVDLEDIAVIDFNKIGNENDKIQAMKSLDIEGGRGCPFRCAFCSTQQFWGNHFRVKSVDKIISEVEFYMKTLGINDFNFQHDLFTFNEKYIFDFCDELIRRNLKITWKCSARIDTVNKDILMKMSKSGCVGIFFGIETGSKTVQKAVNKNLKLEKVDEVLAGLIESDISAVFSFIYGYPMENESDLNDTLYIIYKIRKTATNRKSKSKFLIELWPLAFLPGTKMGEDYFDELAFNEYRGMDFNNSDYTRCKEVDELVKNHKKIFLSYYNIKKNGTKEIQYLNVFIMYLFNFCYSFIYEAVDLLIEEFNNDILKLYYAIFTNNSEKMIKFFKNKTVGGVLPKHDEIGEFFDIIRNYVENSDLYIEKTGMYHRIMESLGMFDSLFKVKAQKKQFKCYGIELYDLLLYKYPQLSLSVSKGMSTSEIYNNVAFRGFAIQEKQNNFMTSDNDFLIHSSFEGNPIELLYLHNRQDFERFIQIMAYRCEPVTISNKSKAFSLTEVINWGKIKVHKKEYLKLGGTEWKKELDSFMSNRKNYTETVIVIGGEVEEEYEDICEKSERSEKIRNYAKIRLFKQLASFISIKKAIKKKIGIENRLLNDCISLVCVTGEYDIEIAKRLIGYGKEQGDDNSGMTKYLVDSMSMEELQNQVACYMEQLQNLLSKFDYRSSGTDELTEYLYTHI